MRKLIIFLVVCFLTILLLIDNNTPKTQAQVVELACGAGTRSVDALSTRNPNTGNIRQYACVDNNGNLTLNGGIGGGGVAGSNTQIQYNNSGAFGANAQLTFNGSNQVTLGAGVGTAILSMSNGGITLSGTNGTGFSFSSPVSATGTITASGNMSANGSLVCQANGTNCPSGTAAAAVNLTTQAANIGATTLLTPGANGYFRISCWIVETQAATTSSTLPTCFYGFTDADSSTAFASQNLTNSNSSNTVGSIGTPVSTTPLTFFAKSGVAITYGTGSYASSGATPMQYALHVRLEGPF